jgi:hypothetical protein
MRTPVHKARTYLQDQTQVTGEIETGIRFAVQPKAQAQ